MSDKSKMLAEAVRSVVEPLEIRRLLTTVTLTGTNSDNTFLARLNTTTNNVDFYVNSTPSTGTPVQSVPKTQITLINIRSEDGPDDWLTIDAPGVTIPINASDAPGLSLSVNRGGVSITGTQILTEIGVGSQAAVTLTGSSSQLITSIISLDGQFQHSGGTLAASELDISESGAFIDAGGSISNGISIYNQGTFKAAFAGSLAGTTGTFYHSGLFIEDAGSGNTNTVGMTFTNGSSSVFNLVSGTAYLPNFSSTVWTHSTMQVDGTAGTLRLPQIYQNEKLTQTGGTLTVDGGAEFRTNVEFRGGSFNAQYIAIGWFTGNQYTVLQSGGTIHAQSVYVGSSSPGSTWTQTGGANFFSYFELTASGSGSSTYNLSDGDLTANDFRIGFSGQGTFNLSGGGQLTGTNELIGSWGGAGTFNQTGGYNDAGNISVGSVLDGTGYYNLSDGYIYAQNEFIAHASYQPGLVRGTFIQTGGYNEAGNSIIIGYGGSAIGDYELHDGSLNVGMLDVGRGTSATYLQTGGDADVLNSVYVGDWTGISSAATLSGGSMGVEGSVYVGLASEGTFNHNAGTLLVSGNLYVSGNGSDGDYANGHGTYSLSGTAGVTASNVFVGYGSNGAMNQTGGTLTTNYFAYNGPSGATGTVTKTGGVRNTVHTVNVLQPSATGALVADEGSPYTLNLSATSSVGNNAISAWAIDWGDQTNDSFNGNPPSRQHTYLAGGVTRTIHPTAFGGGQTYPASPINVLVRNVAAAIAPVAAATVDAGAARSVTTTFSDPGTGQTHTASIDWGDGTISNNVSLTESGHTGSISASHTYLSHADYKAILTVTDSLGAISSIEILSTVNYVQPTFSLAVDPNPSVVGQPTTLTMTAGGPEANGVSSWQVDWGDGTPTKTYYDRPFAGNLYVANWGQEHVYSTPGVYTIHARATDREGQHEPVTYESLTVEAAPVTILNPPTRLRVTEITSTTLNLSWQPAAGSESGFHIYYSKNGSAFTLLQNAPGSDDDSQIQETPIIGLDPGATYVFKVTAYNADVESTASQIVLAQTTSNDSDPLSIEGPSVVTAGNSVKWTASGATTGDTGSPLSLIWSVLLDGHSVASGQGKSIGYLADHAGNYVVQLIAIGAPSGPEVVTQAFTVLPQSIESCKILGPSISELDQMSTFRVDYYGLDLKGNPPRDAEGLEAHFDWTVRDAQGDVVQPSRTTTYASFSFLPPSVGKYTVSVVITRQDGTVGYEGQFSTTATVGAPDNYKKGFVDFGLTNETAEQVIQDSTGNFVVVGSTQEFPLWMEASYGSNANDGLENLKRAFAITRFKADLMIDESWGTNGRTVIFSPSPTDTGIAFTSRKVVRELESGAFLIACSTTSSSVVLFQLTHDGKLDTSFGEDGYVQWNPPEAPSPWLWSVSDMAVAPDGSIVVTGHFGGNYRSEGDNLGIGLVRFNADGTLDDGTAADSTPLTSFGHKGVAVVPNVDYSVRPVTGGEQRFNNPRSLLIAEDGSIYVGGFMLHPVADLDIPIGELEFVVLKFDKNGQPDQTYGTTGAGVAEISFGPRFPSYGHQLLQDDDGRILIVGSVHFMDSPMDYDSPYGVWSNWGTNGIGIARLQPDGQLDQTFGENGKTLSNFYGSEVGWSAALTKDGKIVVAGQTASEDLIFSELNGQQQKRGKGLIARFLPSGIPDDTFGNGGKVILDAGMSVQWQSVIIAADNDIVVVGGAERNANGTDDGFGIAKYRPGDVAARDLTATATPEGKISLNWVDSGTDEDGFVILRSTSPVGPASTDIIGMALRDESEWIDSTVIPGQRYYYKVVAFDTAANGSPRLRGETNIASAQTTPRNTKYVLQETVAVPVTGATVESETNFIPGKNYRVTASGFFTIDKNADPVKQKKADAQWGLYNPSPSRYGVVGRHVQYGIGINDETLDLNRFPYWGDPSTDADHTYSIDFSLDPSKVTQNQPIKLNFHDNYYPDNQAGYYMLVDIYRSLPAAPEQVNATVDRARKRMGLTWINNATDADRIVLQRSKAGAAFETIATLPASAESFTDSQIEFNKTYSYRLIAKNGFGESGYSNVAVAIMTNIAPVVEVVAPITARVGKMTAIHVEADDPDGDSTGLTYSLVNAPSTALINSEGDISGWTPSVEDIGKTFVWRVVVTDEDGATAERFVAATVAPAESTIPHVAIAPHIVSQTQTSASVSVLGSDDGLEGELKYTWITKKRPFGVPLPTFPDNATNSAKNTRIEFHAAGTYVFEVRIYDETDYYGSAELSITIDPALSGAQVEDPLVELGASETHAFHAVALDQFERPWKSDYAKQPAFAWQLTSPTSPGSINGGTGVYAAPSAVTSDENIGVQVSATIDGVSKTANANISLVMAANEPPEIDLNGTEPAIDAEPVSFTQIRLTVKAHDQDGLRSDLRYVWETVNPPAGIDPVVFSENATNAAAVTIASCSAAAALNYTFKVTVYDKRNGSTWASIAVTDTRNFTKVDLTPRVSMLGVSKSTTFSAVAKDQYDRQLLTQPTFEWKVDGAIVAGQTTQDFVYTAPSTESQHVVSVTAISQGVPHTATADVNVIGQRPPVLKILSPSSEADTGVPTLIDKATPIDLVVDDVNDDPVQWFLWMASKSGRQLIAQGDKEVGSAPAQGKMVVTVNPTSYEDGTYTLQLTDSAATDAVVQDQRQIRIYSNYKLGSLSLPFVDASVAVPGGAPIEATRTYDSMRATVSGEFGYGWNLTLTDSGFKTTSRPGSLDFGGLNALRTQDLVYLNTPDGQQHVFSFLPKLIANSPKTIIGQSYTPRFVAVDGSNATLKVATSRTDGFTNTLYSLPATGEWFYSASPTGTGAPPRQDGYNPQKTQFGAGYILVTEDGTKYEYDEDGKLKSSTDLNGRTTNYNASIDGKLAIRKDSLGRITGISEVPSFDFNAANIKASDFVEYTYDDSGDLRTVRNRAGELTQFEYEQTPDHNSTHRLIRIIAPSGVAALAAEYDPDNGLLSKLTNAAGKSVPVSTGSFSTQATSQAITDPEGKQTENIYDARGNVIREISRITDASGVSYRVTVHHYEYGEPGTGEMYLENKYGVGNLNKLWKSEDYAPFIVKSTDDPEQRFKLAPGESLLQRRVEYKPLFDNDDFNQINDPSLFQPVSESVAGPHGLRTTTFLKYDAPGKPSIIKDSYGAHTWMLYDPVTHNLLATINALGEGTQTEYATSGAAKGLPVATYRVKAAGGSDTQLPTITTSSRELLSTTTYYESTNVATGAFAGRVSTSTTYTNNTDAGQLTTRYKYDAEGRTTEIWRQWTDANGAHSVRDSLTEYDAAGRVFKVTDAHGQLTETHYNTAGQVAYTVDAYGGKTASVYDTSGRVVRTVYPDGIESRTAYDDMGRAAWTSDRFYSGATVDSNGVPSAASNTITSLVTRTLYDSLGRTSGTERYKDLTISISRDGTLSKSVAPGVAQLRSDRRLSLTGTAYDEQGRVKETKDAAGLVAQTEYYNNGQVYRTRTVADGMISPWTVYDYDISVSNAVKQAIAAATGQTAVSYDGVTDANGHTTLTYKDAIGRAIRTQYADGSFVDMAYGPFGSITKTYDQRKTSDLGPPTFTERHYDLSGRLTDVYLPAVIDADPDSATFNQSVRPRWQYAYDANGNETGQLDPKNRPTTFGYDQFGQRTSRTLPPDSDSDTTNDTERWTYDAFGRTKTHTDFNNQATAYSYSTDARFGGRLEHEYRFAAGVAALASDGSINTTAAAERTDYHYDNRGRQDVVTEYADGNMATATRTTSYDFDPITGGVTRVTAPEGVLNHAYDSAAGRLVRTWTDNNDTIYRYDGQGRLWKVIVTKLNGQSLATLQTTTYTYDPVGNLLTTALDEGTPTVPSDDLVTTDTYDEVNRLKTLTAKRGTTVLFDQTYDYESDGQKDKVTEHRGSVTTAYDWTYDAINRLTDESYANSGDTSKNYAAHYGFDLSGNRVIKTQTGANAATTVSTYNARDELKTTTTNGVTSPTTIYDANGNTLNDGTRTFTWDLRNRMASVTTAGTGVMTTYAYDNDGLRVSKKIGSGPKRVFVNDALNPTGYNKPVEEKVNGNVDVSYVIGLAVLGQANSTTGYLSLVQDGQGKTRSVLNLNGVDVQPADYDAYGNALKPGQTVTPWQNPDGYSDFESGLTQQGIRPFDRMIGRAKNQDPTIFGAGDWQDANLYSYVGGSPILMTDPSGLFGVVEMGMSMFSIMQQYGSRAVAAYNVYDKVSTIKDASLMVAKYLTTGTLDPIAAALLMTEFLPFGKLLHIGIVGKFVKGAEESLAGIYKNAKGLLPQNKISELIGEVGAGLVAKAHGWIPTTFPRKYHGIESVFEDAAGNIIILEAKGGTADLARGQMSQKWILDRIGKLRLSADPLEKAWGDKLQAATSAGTLKGGVVWTEIDHAAQVVKDPEFLVKNWNDIERGSF